MNHHQQAWKVLLVGICAAILIAGTFAATTPAIGAAPVKIGKIWKKIKPKADKRYYTKAKANTRFALKPKVLRGAVTLSSAPSGGYSMTPISFGITLDAAPTAHIIPKDAALPAGCSGTPGSPSASAGHLCIFEQARSGFTAPLVCSAVNDCSGTTSAFGAFYFATATTNSGFAYGSWALGVGSFTAARLDPTTLAQGRAGTSPGAG